jgi:hypothetical protein
MLVNIRQHIASIVGIFLALGIGILIGIFMTKEGLFTAEQEKIMAQLEKDLLSLISTRDEMKGKIALLEAEKGTNEEFMGQVLPLLISEKLEGKNLVFIDFGGSNGKLLNELEGLSKKAGASSISSATIYYDVDLPDELKERLELASKDEMLELVVRTLVSGRDAVSIEPLVEAGFVKLKGEALGVADSVIVLAPGVSESSKKTYKSDLALIDVLKKLDVKILGVESTDVKSSRMGEYRSRGISTIDNANTFPGRLAFIYALKGHTGNYGIKNSATSLLPPIS